MTDEERERMREWVKNWKKTGEFLEEMRREEIRQTITSQALAAFDTAFRSAVYLNRPELTSGFVEFHRILSKLK